MRSKGWEEEDEQVMKEKNENHEQEMGKEGKKL